jgi:amino acid transporter
MESAVDPSQSRRSRREKQRDPGLSRNSLGTSSIVFLVIAAAAPMGGMIGAATLVVAFGNGAGAPGTYLYAAVILACFAAGYAAMSRKVTNAGAFYAYISRGIGRPFGAAGAYVAIVAYNAVAIGVVAALGFFAEIVFDEQLGVYLHWYWWSAIAIVLTAYFAYNKVELSAKILGVVLVLEVLALVVMDVGVVAERGLSVFSLDSFSPSTVFTGSAGLAFVFAFNSFIGFEATAIFGEEARDPKRTVPKATYLAIALIGTFYAITAWCIVSFYSGANVQEVAQTEPDSFVFAVGAVSVGTWLSDLMQILLVTSFFASLLGIHNVAARYFFALGREGLAPKVLGRSHPRSHSPWVGSAVAIFITSVPIAAVAISGGDPYLGLTAVASALGSIGIIALQGGASLSTIGFFRKRRDTDITVWNAVIGPLLGALALGAVTYLGLHNYAALTGKSGGWENQLPWVLALAAAIGVGFALYLRATRPDVYRSLGENMPSERDHEQAPRERAAP